MENGIVTFLDVLGWKGAWQRLSGVTALESLEVLTKFTQIYADQWLKGRIQGQPPENVPQNLSFRVLNISDTIALVSTPLEGKVAIGIHQHVAIASALLCHAMEQGLPMRGAIAVGDFIAKGDSFIGPAIDEVAAWHEAGDWIGVHLCPSAMWSDKFNRFTHIMQHRIPSKAGGGFDSYAVLWPRVWESGDAFGPGVMKLGGITSLSNAPKSREDLLSCFLKMGPITPDIYPKYVNTLAFYDKWAKQRADELQALSQEKKT
jgi:hypothetical protein